MIPINHYGLALRVLRERQGMAAKDLSLKAGVADYTVSRIENGKLKLEFITAVHLTKALGVTLDELANTAASLPAELLECEAQMAQARARLKTVRAATQVRAKKPAEQ